jgi:hemoglobin
MNGSPKASKTDLSTEADVRLMVDSFYGKVREDELLGPIFNGIIGERWPAHLETMYRFWNTVLLESQAYSGRPFTPHATLPVDVTHFNRWLTIFGETVDKHFVGEKASEAKWRGEKMAGLFLSKIEYKRANPGKIVL